MNNILTRVVKVHCGSAHVRGKARLYPYYISSLFTIYTNYLGELKYKNTGISSYPRRSYKLCKKDAETLAKKHKATFLEGYGSLHNTHYLIRKEGN